MWNGPVILYVRVSSKEQAEKRHSVPSLFSTVLAMNKAALTGMLC